ncbi:MAG: Rrf2 family transcriptional regulator [Ferruginibacter sp.]
MLSKKNQYALKAISYLGARYQAGPIPILEIAEKKKIPLKFLENILLDLKNKGLLDSRKGKGGGYFMIQDPGKISLAKIIRAVDGPIAMLPCVSLYFYQQCDDCDEKKCRINKVFAEARDATLQILENRTVKDII